jgi:hypothetical protein
MKVKQERQPHRFLRHSHFELGVRREGWGWVGGVGKAHVDSGAIMLYGDPDAAIAGPERERRARGFDYYETRGVGWG